MATSTVTLAWGKCTVQTKKSGETAYSAFATPVEGSTQLETSEGDKLEAKVEGGGVEAVKYKKNNYTLRFQMRQVPERTDPISDVDGVVDGEYSVQVIPEDATAVGVYIERAVCHVNTTYTAEEGTMKEYIFDALEPSTADASVVIGTIS